MPQQSPPPQVIDRAAISATWERIATHVRRTPLLKVNAADFGLAPAPLVLKLECLQHTGSFKARGAFANLLLRDVPKVGVAAASGGNHGAAVAYAAIKLGVPARIFVPAISSPAKIARIKSYGAELVVGGETYADALDTCERYIADSGALSVHAYDQPETLLGQGTVGLELASQDRNIDTVLVSVGGGGLIGGMAAWYAGTARVIGVEPVTSRALHAGLLAGRPVDVSVAGIAADSLGARSAGGLMFPIAQAHVERVALVEDEAIKKAQEALWDVARVAVEPGGAAAMAALLSGQVTPAHGERLCVLVCGANTTAVTFG